jgi:hypothetical protein
MGDEEAESAVFVPGVSEFCDFSGLKIQTCAA